MGARRTKSTTSIPRGFGDVVIDAIKALLDVEVYHWHNQSLRYLHPRFNLHGINVVVVEETKDEFITIFRINETCAMVKFEFGGNA